MVPCFSLLRYCRTIVLTDPVPIDHAEKGLDIVRPAVLVFEIVCMLPDIESQHGRHAETQRTVLVGCGGNLQFAVSKTNQAQPLPNNKVAADEKSVLNLSKLPNLLSIADAISPLTATSLFSIGQIQQ